MAAVARSPVLQCRKPSSPSSPVVYLTTTRPSPCPPPPLPHHLSRPAPPPTSGRIPRIHCSHVLWLAHNDSSCVHHRPHEASGSYRVGLGLAMEEVTHAAGSECIIILGTRRPPRPQPPWRVPIGALFSFTSGGIRFSPSRRWWPHGGVRSPPLPGGWRLGGRVRRPPLLSESERLWENSTGPVLVHASRKAWPQGQG